MPKPTRKHVKGLRRASPSIAPRFVIGPPISKIDTRPMVFVTAIIGLVLLLHNVSQERTHTLLIDLPQDSYPPTEFSLPSHMTVEITANDAIRFNGKLVAVDTLSDEISKFDKYWPVVVRAAPNASYGTTATVLSEIVSAGVASNDICFDDLEAYKHFEGAGLNIHRLAHSNIYPVNILKTLDIAPNLCGFWAGQPTI